VDKILGLIAAVQRSGPMPGGRGHKQLRNLSQMPITVHLINGYYYVNILRVKESGFGLTLTECFVVIGMAIRFFTDPHHRHRVVSKIPEVTFGP
jgi:hypothetical protein